MFSNKKVAATKLPSIHWVLKFWSGFHIPVNLCTNKLWYLASLSRWRKNVTYSKCYWKILWGQRTLLTTVLFDCTNPWNKNSLDTSQWEEVWVKQATWPWL